MNTMSRETVSVVIPICNEVDSIPSLYLQLNDVFCRIEREYEIIFVDDGSTDGSLDRLRALSERHPQVKIIILRRNYGQTSAMQAGLHFATGDVVVTMDGDLQNDPSDIPMMLDTLDEGFDLVHGWRKNRKDAWLNRRLPSMIANWLVSKTTCFSIQDLGCTLKAMRREIAQDLELYGEMHRFVPILAYQRGARCAEVVTRHRPRQFGKTKYGIGRTFRVILDLLTVKFLLDYFASPMKLFGTFALFCLFGSALSGIAVGAMKIISAVDVTGNPLFLLTALLMTSGIQFLGLGLLGEINARTYFGAQDKQQYAVRELINFTDPEDAPTIDPDRLRKLRFQPAQVLARLTRGRNQQDGHRRYA